MIFTILGIFPDFSQRNMSFSDFIFDFKTSFYIKKTKKIVLIFARALRGCDVACKAKWQHHADPRSAYVAHDI